MYVCVDVYKHVYIHTHTQLIYCGVDIESRKDLVCLVLNKSCPVSDTGLGSHLSLLSARIPVVCHHTQLKPD